MSDNVARGAIDLVIEPAEKDLGGFSVRRVLPSGRRRMVGPFIFFDHMGPARFAAGQGIDVRPHPHIGLATITYLFEGEIMHRDSLGFVQPIQPGAVNLMTAGRGIVHSERAGDDRQTESRLHGIQSWMALPESIQETAPAFVHYPSGDLPRVTGAGSRTTIIIGRALGETSPVDVHASMLYLDVNLAATHSYPLPAGYDELAVYVVDGELEIDGARYGAGVMAVAQDGVVPTVTAVSDAHFMVIGGEPLGARHIWWNFVSSSRERIEQAKQDWSVGRFDEVPGETEFIPLPED